MALEADRSMTSALGAIALPRRAPRTIEAGRPAFTPDRWAGVREFWARFSRDKAAVFGGALLLFALLVALLGPMLTPFDPTAQNSALRMATPGTNGYLLGGDHLGRDILSRLLAGARLSLTVGFLPVVMAVGFGLFFGLAAGYYGKRVDMVISRGIEIVLAFPSILLAIGIVSALGPGLDHALLAIVIVAIPSFARIVRGTVVSLRELEYVHAARMCGASDFRIIAKHIVPNCMAPIIVFSTMELGRMLIFAAGLSFLGLGAQPPTPEWGAMLAEGRNVLAQAPHVATIPGLAIFVVALGANLLGDGLRDTLDPRMRNR